MENQERQPDPAELAESREQKQAEQAPEFLESVESTQELITEADRQVSLLDEVGDAAAQKIADNLGVELDEEVQQELSGIAEEAAQAATKLAGDLQEEKVDVSQLSTDEMIDLVGEWGKFTALPEKQKKVMADRLLKDQPDAVLSVPQLYDTLSAEQKYQLAERMIGEDHFGLLRSTEFLQQIDASQKAELLQSFAGMEVPLKQVEQSGFFAGLSPEEALGAISSAYEFSDIDGSAFFSGLSDEQKKDFFLKKGGAYRFSWDVIAESDNFNALDRESRAEIAKKAAIDNPYVFAEGGLLFASLTEDDIVAVTARISREKPQEFLDRKDELAPLSVKDTEVWLDSLREQEPELLLLKSAELLPEVSDEMRAELADRLIREHPQATAEKLSNFDLDKEAEARIIEVLLFETSELPTETVVDALLRHPDIIERIAERSGELTCGQQSVVEALGDRFLCSFESDPEGAIEQSIRNRKVAMQIFDAMPEAAQNTVLPTLIEHAMDSDFGDRQLAEQLLHRIEDPDDRAKLTARLEAMDDLSKRIEVFQKELAELSVENRKRMLEELTETHGQEKVQEIIDRIEEGMMFTVNCSFDTVTKILEAGRLKSSWETHTRDYIDYKDKRHQVERSLGIRSKGTEKDPHPIYGAVGFNNGHDEKYGTAPGYGNVFLKIKPEAVRERGSCTYGDSFHGDVKPRQLSVADCAAAKAKVELDQQERYVEFQLMGGATIEDIESINLPRHLEDQLADQVAELRRQHPNVTIEFV